VWTYVTPTDVLVSNVYGIKHNHLACWSPSSGGHSLLASLKSAYKVKHQQQDQDISV